MIQRALNSLFILTISFLITSCNTENNGVVSLTEEWNFRLGGEKIDEAPINKKIDLHGSLQDQGYGNEITKETKWIGKLRETAWLKHSGKQPDGSFKVAGWLQPKKHYVGKAWYKKDIIIPESWKNRRVQLYLERPHITTTLFIDKKEVGSCNSLSTPHIYDLGKLSVGKHTLTICVDNSMPAPVGINAHCVTDHTQTAWNGVIGKIELRSLPEKYIDYIMLFPDAVNREVKMKIFFAGDIKIAGEKVAINFIPPEGISAPLSLTLKVPSGIVMEKTVKFANIALWDEFDPNIYKLNVKLYGEKGVEQNYSTQFGFFTHKIKDQQFIINGRPTLMRGTLDCASFPLTGYPSMDINYWRNVFKVCKSMGLNHIRYHSWTPPEVALTAADEAGMYLQCENAWTNVSNKELQNYIIKETARIVKRLGNHPSFMMAVYGNEPGGLRKRKNKEATGKNWLKKWVDFVREADGNRRFYTSAAGWGETENSDYYDLMRGMRVYPWSAGLKSTINANPPEFVSTFNETTAKSPEKSYIAHETGEWCVFPDFDEIKLYTGFLKPENFNIFKRNMKDNHLFRKWRDFFNASGKLQTLCYKFEIEKLRRTKGCGGYQLLGINDFPGQGTALVGPVNVFWKVKSYTSPEEYRCFNGKTAILAKLPKFIYKSNETAKFAIDISHFGKDPIKSSELLWSLASSDKKVVKKGSFKLTEIPLGLTNIVKNCSISLSGLKAPAQYRLNLSIAESDIHNYYDIWVYPAEKQVAKYADIKITTNLKEAFKELKQGKTVLLSPKSQDIIQPAERKPVVGFSTIFWNTVWANRQPPTVMGVNPDPANPLFKLFPTENYSNYQWWYILTEVKSPLWLDKLPGSYKPLIYLIDDWFTNRRLALMAEAKVGKGKLLISAVPIATSSKENIVLNQLRDAVLNYMSSRNFNPAAELSKNEIKTFIAEK
jgi:hypothetical protein